MGKYKVGSPIISSMQKVFGVTEANSKEKTGAQFVIQVVAIVDAQKKIAQIKVLDNKEFSENDVVTTYLPTVVMNFVEKDKTKVVNGAPIVIEYTGKQKFADGKSKFGKDWFHGWKFFEAVKS